MGLQARLDTHFSHAFSQSEFGRTTLDGPIRRLAPSFYVGHFVDLETGCWIYYTNGCSLYGKKLKQEFIIIDQHKRLENVEILHWAAFYNTSNTILLGSIIDIGMPWYRDSDLDHLLVSLPYPFSVHLGVLRDDSGPVQIRWLLPITKAESTYASENGVESLEALFDKEGIDFIDHYRLSVVF